MISPVYHVLWCFGVLTECPHWDYSIVE